MLAMAGWEAGSDGLEIGEIRRKSVILERHKLSRAALYLIKACDKS